MFTAELIDPDSRKRRISCSSCGISYSARDYKLLYESKKIIYFKYRNKILCHECLYKKLKELEQGKKMHFIILNKDFKFKCFFEPDNQVSGDDIPFDDLF